MVKRKKIAEKNSGYVRRAKNWKEYLMESVLIVFSVLLALFLTESINNRHDKRNTEVLLRNIVSELKTNKRDILEMQDYNLQVLHKIDLVLANKGLQDSLVANHEFRLNVIAPQGVLFRYLEDNAWAIARSNNIMSKLDIQSISLLTKVYEDIYRIRKVEDEVAKVIFDRTSRDPKQIQATLIIIRDIYHGWAVDRVPGLLNRIDLTIGKIGK